MLWEEVRRMVGNCWLEDCGSPPMLLPSCCRRDWNGIYLPCTDASGDAELVLPRGERRNKLVLPGGERLEVCTGGDDELVLPGGKRMYSDTTFDFRNPRTDYDRLCAQGNGLFLFPVGSGQALVIGDGGPRFVGWWPEEKLLVVVGPDVPDLTRRDKLRWSEVLVWRLPVPEFHLMASCLHGLEVEVVAELKRMSVDCTLDAGVYRVLSAKRGRANPAGLYKLVPA
jgi:hypothetical protein